MEAGLISFQVRSAAIAEATKLWQQDMADVHKMKGFRSGMLLIDPVSGMGFAMGLWDTQEDAQAFGESEIFKTFLDHLAPLLITRPLRQMYQVQAAIPPVHQRKEVT